MTFLREEICEGCKEPVKVYAIPIIGGPNKGKVDEFPYGCKCEDIKLAEEARKAKKRQIQSSLREMFNRYSLINKKLLNANFDNYYPKNKKQKYAKEQALKYVEIFDLNNPKNLLFSGSVGVGKSHLAKSIADGVMAKDMEKKQYNAIFISVPKLMRKLRSSYHKDSEVTEDKIFNMLETVDLLVLDDLGVGKQTDWVTEKIYDLIDSRQGMHTIYTSNFSPDELMQLMGERDFSRVFNEDSTLIEVEGENQRLADLKEGK